MNIEIFRPIRSDSEKLSEFKLEVLGSNIIFDVKTFYKGDSYNGSITIPIDFDNGSFEVVLRESKEKCVLSYFNVFDFVERNTCLRDAVYNYKKIARFIKESENIYVWILSPCLDVPGFSNLDMDKTKSLTGLCISKSSWFSDNYNLVVKKASLLNNVDFYKSISYIESQVDLVTSLLLSLLKGSDVDKDLLFLLEKANQNSVLTVKSLGAIDNEVSNEKKRFRVLQESYYKTLKG